MNNVSETILTASSWLQKAVFCKNKLKHILSDIDFGDINVSPEEARHIDEMYEKSIQLIKYLETVNPQRRMNLEEKYQIIYNEIMNKLQELEG